jgi:hypothetical protein
LGLLCCTVLLRKITEKTENENREGASVILFSDRATTEGIFIFQGTANVFQFSVFSALDWI